MTNEKLRNAVHFNIWRSEATSIIHHSTFVIRHSKGGFFGAWNLDIVWYLFFGAWNFLYLKNPLLKEMPFDFINVNMKHSTSLGPPIPHNPVSPRPF